MLPQLLIKAIFSFLYIYIFLKEIKSHIIKPIQEEENIKWTN